MPARSVFACASDAFSWWQQHVVLGYGVSFFGVALCRCGINALRLPTHVPLLSVFSRLATTSWMLLVAYQPRVVRLGQSIFMNRIIMLVINGALIGSYSMRPLQDSIWCLVVAGLLFLLCTIAAVMASTFRSSWCCCCVCLLLRHWQQLCTW